MHTSMAKTPQRPVLGKQPRVAWTNPWTRKHYMYIAAGVGVIALGFVLMATGVDQWDNPLAIDVAPLVLVIGYCVLIPLAIMWSGKNEK